MAFRFRKFQHSLRLIPSTKSFGFSTRVNEGDQTKSSPSFEGGSLANTCQTESFNKYGSPLPQRLSLYPLTRPASQHDALQLVEAVPNSLKVHEADAVSLACLNALRPPIDDLYLLMSTVKPVALTCDDILPVTEDCCNNDQTDLTWERISVRVMTPSSNHHGGSTESYSDTYYTMNSVGVCDIFNNNNHCFSNFPNNFEDQPFLHCHKSDADSFHRFLFSTPTQSGKKGGETNKAGPSADQLHNARERLEKTVPRMFTTGYDYSMLHKNVVFENNLFGTNRVKKGIIGYALELMRLRFRFFARYTSTQMEVLNVTTHEQNGTIRIHWRLKGLPQAHVLKFWRLFQTREDISKDDWEWLEAFSYYHIGKDGLVHKHRIDRMLSDGEETNKLSDKLTKLLNPAKPLVS